MQANLREFLKKLHKFVVSHVFGQPGKLLPRDVGGGLVVFLAVVTSGRQVQQAS